jgi:hypothetical protein
MGRIIWEEAKVTDASNQYEIPAAPFMEFVYALFTMVGASFFLISNTRAVISHHMI